MTTGIILLNFGEPTAADEDRVANYQERIFLANGDREHGDEAVARERARELAERRAPDLVEEYEAIGGSPLNRQSVDQAASLAAVCRDRGFDDVETYVGMQYTDPAVDDAVAAARADGVDRLVGLPTYPLCGPSTTVAALEALRTAVASRQWEVDTVTIAGWHRHPGYRHLRCDTLRTFASSRGLALGASDTELVFAAHGTPRRLLEGNSRYLAYVEEWCDLVAASLGVGYSLGFQNHDSRGDPWTGPSIEAVVESVRADRVVVDPVSFVHEQSETLWDLDRELRDLATDRGLEFYRVPVPHDDRQLAEVLADLVEPVLAGTDPADANLRPCACTGHLDALCRSCPDRDCVEGR